MKGLRLYKIEKLCSKVVIEHMFAPGSDSQRALSYPLRAVWQVPAERRDGSCCPRFLVMVPKRRLRHAVDRVTMRRRVREAYRLNRHLLPAGRPLDIAFVYVANELAPYQSVEKAMRRLLSKISEA